LSNGVNQIQFNHQPNLVNQEIDNQFNPSNSLCIQQESIWKAQQSILAAGVSLKGIFLAAQLS